MIHDLAEDFTRTVTKKVREREELISQGKAQSFDDYRERCGRIAGLKEALELFNDVVKRHGEMKDDE